MLKHVACALIVSDVSLNKGIIDADGQLVAQAQGVVMAAHAFFRTQDGEVLPVEETP